MSARKAREAQIRDRFRRLKGSLTERARRLFVASEALAFGYGGIVAAARATGMAPSVIGRGISEVRAIEAGTAPSLVATRSRRPGGGRKKATEKDPTLVADLKTLVESTTRGDPESSLLWTARSLQNIVAALEKQGHRTSRPMVARLLKSLGYSLQANRKRLEGMQHPDRNAQFEHINELVRRRLEANEPTISVDTKKKELVGPYKNGGRELRPQREPDDVNVHDFADAEKGKVAPYGVYDLQKNEAWVSVGVSHDTAEFAVQTIRTLVERNGRPTVFPRHLAADHGRRRRQQRLSAARAKSATSQIRQRYQALKSTLTERARRLFVAGEAMAFGYGGITAASKATGMAPSAIGRGIAEVHAIEAGGESNLDSTRSRRAGGGRTPRLHRG